MTPSVSMSHTIRRTLRPLLLAMPWLLAGRDALVAQTPASGPAVAVYRAGASAVFLIESRGDDGTVLGIGSGFLVDRDVLATNAHVVQGGRAFLKTGAVSLPLEIVRLSAEHDLAVLRVGVPLDAAPLRLADSLPAAGTTVFALGNPQGLERSISEGLVSGVRMRGGHQLLQISAPVSPGSSGGPVLNASGEVVGVTVGYLEGGQNLNFAIPTVTLRAVMQGATVGHGFAEATEALRALLRAPSPMYGDSVGWARRTTALQDALERGAVSASTAAHYLTLATLADSAFATALTVRFADRALRLDRSVADSARALMIDAWFFESLTGDNSALLGRMLGVADTLIASQPRHAPAHRFRSNVLARMERGREAIAAAHRSVEVGQGQAGWSYGWTLVHTHTARFGSRAAEDSAFAAMVRAGQANLYDWRTHAKHLQDREAWTDAAAAYRTVARADDSSPSDACDEGRMWWRAEASDDALAAFRQCIDRYAVATAVDTAQLAFAHMTVAELLVNRHVFAQAVVHARQSMTLKGSNGWAAHELSRALSGLERHSEAAAAAEEAIRLTDGRFASIHFQAGSAYFDLQDWSRCARAYTLVTEMDTESAAAPYNAALCLSKQGFYRDAAIMMEKVLARDPRHPKRADIQRQIATWRR